MPGMDNKFLVFPMQLSESLLMCVCISLSHCWVLVIAWISPYSFLNMEVFAMAAFLDLRESDCPKISQLALCLRQDFSLLVSNYFSKKTSGIVQVFARSII